MILNDVDSCLIMDGRSLKVIFYDGNQRLEGELTVAERTMTMPTGAKLVAVCSALGVEPEELRRSLDFVNIFMWGPLAMPAYIPSNFNEFKAAAAEDLIRHILNEPNKKYMPLRLLTKYEVKEIIETGKFIEDRMALNGRVPLKDLLYSHLFSGYELREEWFRVIMILYSMHCPGLHNLKYYTEPNITGVDTTVAPPINYTWGGGANKKCVPDRRLIERLNCEELNEWYSSNSEHKRITQLSDQHLFNILKMLENSALEIFRLERDQFLRSLPNMLVNISNNDHFYNAGLKDPSRTLLRDYLSSKPLYKKLYTEHMTRLENKELLKRVRLAIHDLNEVLEGYPNPDLDFANSLDNFVKELKNKKK